MSDTYEYPATRIRGELRPTSQVETAVNAFLERPVRPGTMRLYTEAQVFIEQGGQRRRYAEALSKTEREFGARRVAQRIFKLDALKRLSHNEDGSGRLFFTLEDEDRSEMEYIAERMTALEGAYERYKGYGLVYAEFARGSLAADLDRRRELATEAATELGGQLHHPSTRPRMTASGLHVVMHDMTYVSQMPIVVQLDEQLIE
jgi:hypothetical protein